MSKIRQRYYTVCGRATEVKFKTEIRSVVKMDGFGGDFGGSSSSAPTPSGNNQAELQASMNQLVLQLLQNQTRKTCFDKCFGDSFSSTLEQKDQVCLAKVRLS